MASSSLLLKMLVLISLLLIIFTNPTHSSPFYHPMALTESDKVNLSVYYDSLCPDCKTFIAGNLTKVFTTDLHNIVKLKLVPFGNAKIEPPGQSIICQHGKNECYLNAVHACAIKNWPKTETYFHFIECIESVVDIKKNATQKLEDIWKSCTKDLDEVNSILECFAKEKAKKLALKYVNETASLSPPHKSLPWVTVNNKPLYDKYKDFVGEVCKAFKGKSVPKACKSSVSTTKPDL